LVELRFLLANRWLFAVGVVLCQQGIAFGMAAGGPVRAQIEVVTAKTDFCLARNMKLALRMGGVSRSSDGLLGGSE